MFSSSCDTMPEEEVIRYIWVLEENTEWKTTTRHLKKKTQQKQLPQREQDKSFPLWIWAISI